MVGTQYRQHGRYVRRYTARNTYAIHRLLVNGDWVIGALFSHAGFPTLLYLPNAPDGIAARPGSSNYPFRKDCGHKSAINPAGLALSSQASGAYRKPPKPSCPKT